MNNKKEAYPLVTCVITVYNYALYISEAIESVLNQSYNNIEIIVIDDGSVDNTFDIVSKYAHKVNYFKQENRGLSVALNKGIKMSKGDYIAFLDGDDYWHPDMIEKLYNELQYKKDSMLVFCNFKQFYSPEISENERKKYLLFKAKGEPLSKLTMLARKITFTNIGLFNEARNHSDFIDWFSRCQDNNIIYHWVDEELAYRRIHGANMTLKCKPQRKEELLSLIWNRINP